MKGIISRGKFQLTVNERSLTTFLGKLKRSGGASIDQPRRVVQKIWRKSSDPAVQSRYSRRENSNWFLARSRFRLSIPLSLSLDSFDLLLRIGGLWLQLPAREESWLAGMCSNLLPEPWFERITGITSKLKARYYRC